MDTQIPATERHEFTAQAASHPEAESRHPSQIVEGQAPPTQQSLINCSRIVKHPIFILALGLLLNALGNVVYTKMQDLNTSFPTPFTLSIFPPIINLIFSFPAWYSPGIESRLKSIEDRIRHLIPPDKGEDLALYPAGAQVIPEFTTLPFDANHRPSFFNWLFSARYTMDLLSLSENSPVAALQRRVNVGECWHINRSFGTLGIRLVKAAGVHTVVLDDLHPDLMLPHDAMMAIQHFTVWLLVEQALLSRIAPVSVEVRDVYDFVKPPFHQLPAGINSTAKFVAVTRGTYNSSISMRQRFSIDTLLRPMNLPFTTVILDIGSNWGSIFTRICHVGVYGDEYNPSLPTGRF